MSVNDVNYGLTPCGIRSAHIIVLLTFITLSYLGMQYSGRMAKYSFYSIITTCLLSMIYLVYSARKQKGSCIKANWIATG